MADIKTPTCEHGKAGEHYFFNEPTKNHVWCPGPPSEPGTLEPWNLHWAEVALREYGKHVHDSARSEAIIASMAGARAQAPSDEPLRALVESLRIHPPDRTWTGVSNPNARYNEALDDVLALLPRSVQAQLLTDEQIAAAIRARNLHDERDGFGDGARWARALLARAARGQDAD